MKLIKNILFIICAIVGFLLAIFIVLTLFQCLTDFLMSLGILESSDVFSMKDILNFFISKE